MESSALTKLRRQKSEFMELELKVEQKRGGPVQTGCSRNVQKSLLDSLANLHMYEASSTRLGREPMEGNRPNDL